MLGGKCQLRLEIFSGSFQYDFLTISDSLIGSQITKVKRGTTRVLRSYYVCAYLKISTTQSFGRTGSLPVLRVRESKVLSNFGDEIIYIFPVRPLVGYVDICNAIFKKANCNLIRAGKHWRHLIFFIETIKVECCLCR